MSQKYEKILITSKNSMKIDNQKKTREKHLLKEKSFALPKARLFEVLIKNQYRMKKTLLLILISGIFFLSSFAGQCDGNYTTNISTIENEGDPSSSTNTIVVKEDEGKITLTIKNYTIGDMNVGDATFADLDATEND